MKHSILLVLSLISFSVLASDPQIEVTKIWDDAPHNAFTDLIRYHGKFYCTFREGTGHVPGETGEDGKIRILFSEDGDKWESIGLLAKKDYDLRDSKLSVTPKGRLMVLMGGSNYDGNILLNRLTHVSFLEEKKISFSQPQPVKIDKKIRSQFDWLWRVRWFDGTGYGVVYQKKDRLASKAFLMKTKDGIRYSLVSQLNIDGIPGESTVYMNPDREMVIVVRREGGDQKGYIGYAKPPYTEWEWNSLGVRLGGPNIIPFNTTSYILGTRSYNNDIYRTALYFTDKKGPAKQFLELPSGGDTSYPGMLIYEDELWVSYYSSHEGKSSIYLAKIPMDHVNQLFKK